MQKNELLAHLQSDYDTLMSVTQAIQAKGLENDIIDTKWVLKDVLSHLSLYEREAANALKKKTLENNSFYKRTDDDRNEENFNATHNKSFQELLDNSNKVFKDLYSEIEKLTQEELDGKFPGMTRPVWQFIVGQSYGHYPDHIPKLQKRFNV